MDWPNRRGTENLDKRFRDDYRNAAWGHLIDTYGWYSVAWLAAAVWCYGDRERDRREDAG